MILFIISIVVLVLGLVSFAVSCYLINKNHWHKFSERLPTNEEYEQVKVLLGRPGWAIWVEGMFTFDKNKDLKGCLSEYNRQFDSYIEWNSMLPTHWRYMPEKPKK